MPFRDHRVRLRLGTVPIDSELSATAAIGDTLAEPDDAADRVGSDDVQQVDVGQPVVAADDERGHVVSAYRVRQLARR